MIDAIFDWCVTTLHITGDAVGMTYKEINVWLFIVIHPAITVGLIIYAIRKWKQF